MYDKLRTLVEGMSNLGKQLKTAEKTYDAVYAKLATGKGNLVRQVEQFRELGAQVKKPMDAKLIEQAELEQDAPDEMQLEEDSDLLLAEDTLTPAPQDTSPAPKNQPSE